MSVRILEGDCRDVLATLPADSVQCVVTSPPYYGLRDYGVAGQIGLEATPDAYLATMVAVFREVRRVLRPDGTCWVNMGDSYAHGMPGGGSVFDNGRTDGRTSYEGDKARGRHRASTLAPGLKPKDLLMMPARLALALQADGWWLRSDIIWHKPNPMPESCTDRPTSAHEHVFLFSKRARYFYDADAVREEAEYGASVDRHGASGGPFQAIAPGGGFINGSRAPGNGGSRNLRNVWTIATYSYIHAHFATYPPALAERCIKAGTSERGCCAQCGAPWVRQSTKTYEPTERTPAPNKGHLRVFGEKASGMTASGFIPNRDPVIETTGWSPSCKCDADTVPCVVLDPFAGAGTTLLVADRLQRDAIGIELSPGYTEMAMERCRADAPLFTALPPAEPPEDARMADLFAWAAD